MNLYCHRGSPSTYRILRRRRGTSSTLWRRLFPLISSPGSGSAAKARLRTPASPAPKSIHSRLTGSPALRVTALLARTLDPSRTVMRV